MTGYIEWKWSDPSHFRAHSNDFFRPAEEILREIEDLIPPEERIPGRILHGDFSLQTETGLTGLRDLSSGTDDSFWAYRSGRNIPSHLILGEKKPTVSICLWGRWEREDLFIIHTLYPGHAAPKEIHDKTLKLDEIAESVRFWSRHAIVTEEGAFSFEPYDRETRPTVD